MEIFLVLNSSGVMPSIMLIITDHTSSAGVVAFHVRIHPVSVSS